MLEGVERTLLDGQISKWGETLLDNSWFMRVVNENIVRMANAEGGCTARFWEE